MTATRTGPMNTRGFMAFPSPSGRRRIQASARSRTQATATGGSKPSRIIPGVGPHQIQMPIRGGPRMGIQDSARPEWGHSGGPTHCIGPHPPLPQIGGKGTKRQGEPAYLLIYAVSGHLQWLSRVGGSLRCGAPPARARAALLFSLVPPPIPSALGADSWHPPIGWMPRFRDTPAVDRGGGQRDVDGVEGQLGR